MGENVNVKDCRPARIAIGEGPVSPQKRRGRTGKAFTKSRGIPLMVFTRAVSPSAETLGPTLAATSIENSMKNILIDISCTYDL